jgi:hypothetical protein
MLNSKYPYISTEGGPIIVADFSTLSGWKGAFDSGQDYERACKSLTEGKSIAQMTVNGGTAVVWNFGGAGTANVVDIGSDITLVRYWADDFLDDTSLIDLLRESLADVLDSGLHQEFLSDCLLASWATEDTSDWKIPNGQRGEPEGTLSVGHAAACLKVSPGRYRVGHREAECNGIKFVTLDFLK